MAHNLNEAGDIWALVPVKSLSTAKSRLKPAFSPAQRNRLALNLLRSTLEVLTDLKQQAVLAGIVVVSSDTVVLDLAARFSAHLINEQQLAKTSPSSGGQDKLNHALRSGALRVIDEYNPARLLILLADLPLLQAGDVRYMIEQAAGANIVLAPDRQEQGTNALLLEAGSLVNFTFLFGPGSYGRYRQTLEKQRQPYKVCRRAGLSFDLDRREDFDELPVARQQELLSG